MKKFSRTTAVAVTVALAGALAACADQPRYGSQYPAQSTYPTTNAGYPAPAPAGMEYGTVSNIETLQARSGTSGVGAVAGAVLGGVLGNQVGKGSGRAAATVIGAVGGGVVGNQVEGRTGNNDGRVEGYRITVQLDQGGQRAFDVSSPGDLRPGDRVRLNGGQISRM
ncbi:glycine zipper 2TM domain-containing protein [Paracidovorax konjaci]|uniref:Outer membrane lipoprotein SlyB n=1 Tax=Paracidovorax konjaci TaxID=32040 RepID=A0A1I1RVG1_9BURK|nr:glycine zipper 2TM domain-containing protein [Paracidovorax konjaci]SFD38326.1 Outer membrane lipoprotein SlyB [Paracidovorax konjaci]